MFYSTQCITPKRVTSLQGPSLRHCAGATMSQRWRTVGNNVFDLTARDLNIRPPMLSRDHLISLFGVSYLWPRQLGKIKW